MANRRWVDFRGATAIGPRYDERLNELVQALRAVPAAERPTRDDTRRWPPGPRGERLRATPRATLRISANQVTLTGGPNVVTQRPRGLREVTQTASRQTHLRLKAEPGEVDAALAAVGQALSGDFLAGPVGAALADLVEQAEVLNEVLELGVEVPAEDLAGLPWETLLRPQTSGEIPEVGGSPLVLQRNIALYRQVADPRVAPAHKVRGPLRLLVVIASPETGDGNCWTTRPNWPALWPRLNRRDGAVRRTCGS